MRTDTVTKKLQGGHSWSQEVRTDFIMAEFWLFCSWSCVRRIRRNVTKIRKMLLLLNISGAIWLTLPAFSKDRAHIVSKETLSSSVFAIDVQSAEWFPIAGLSANWQGQNVVLGSLGSPFFERHPLHQEPGWILQLLWLSWDSSFTFWRGC